MAIFKDSTEIQADILAAVQEQAEVAPGAQGPTRYGQVKPGAISFDRVKSVVDNLDAFIQQASPVIATFSPLQYRAWVTSIAAVLHAATGEIDKFGGHA